MRTYTCTVSEQCSEHLECDTHISNLDPTALRLYIRYRFDDHFQMFTFTQPFTYSMCTLIIKFYYSKLNAVMSVKDNMTETYQNGVSIFMHDQVILVQDVREEVMCLPQNSLL